MIDSLSDSDTAKLTLHSAISGNLILSGIYAREASEALTQYSALCQEPFLVAQGVKLVIVQSLVRRICPECRVQIRVSEEVEARVKRQLGTSRDLKFYKGSGCDKCKNGYRGRVPIFEILKPTSEIMDLVVSGASKAELHQAAISCGMITMRQDGLLKVVSGLTTIDEVIKATRSAEG
jgi:type IV pilus assembly protein PilB